MDAQGWGKWQRAVYLALKSNCQEIALLKPEPDPSVL
ncbi:hypothetical protein SLEP1_g45380 [Rubroshorea leprosula]|uniref:Uncharacterized protein n=1 Tax=Rubroshorea leprosula TaxID=152421 RepID=A0AAV5LIT8_9ROSI|nr:hypothetical protein SLEP1_g45380 [Rubroshorea leprosula]